jgi:hypothetical protein
MGAALGAELLNRKAIDLAGIRSWTLQTFSRCGISVPDVATGLLLFGLILTVAVTFRSYGFTTDEGADNLKAARILRFFASFGRDSREIAGFDSHNDLNIYGAMPDILALVLQKLIPPLSVDARHLVSASFGLIGIYFLYRTGREFLSPAIGFFAALFLACNPMWFGYMFFNTKDIPFAAMLIAALYYCLCALTGRSGSHWLWLKIALSVGLLAATKLIGILVLGATGVVFLACLKLVGPNDELRLDGLFVGRLAKIIVSGTLGCLVCFAVFWPQFYFWSPANLVQISALFINFEYWRGVVQIHGDYIPFDKVPWYYTITYIVISMPSFLLALCVFGIGLGAIKRTPIVVASGVTCALVLGIQALSGSQAYNGYRHFIFLLPLMMLVAAYPVGHLLNTKHSVVSLGALAIVAMAVGSTSMSMYQLFPYQYSFYNQIVGGIRGADGRYYIDVWKSALREALQKIEEFDETRSRDGKRLRVFYSCGSTLNFVGYPDLEPVEDAEGADYVVSLRRGCKSGAFEVFNLPLIAEVRRQDVVFAAIYAGAKR